MDEEKILGPLTLRQFLYSAGSFVAIFFAYTYLDTKLSIPIIIVTVGFFISGFISHPAVTIDENYIKLKRSNCVNLEDFQRWLRKKIAMVQSQISIRESRGLVPDPKLDDALRMFQSAMQNIR
ncbi:MAG: PrgI family protein [bacterium]